VDRFEFHKSATAYVLALAASTFMKRALYIVGLVCVSVMDLLGQARQESKDLLKGLLGADFLNLGELDSRLYCDVISVNGGLTRGMIYNDSATHSIKYWLSNDFDFKETKLIEFEIVKIDTSETHSVWVKVVTAWTKNDSPKTWSLDKKNWNFTERNIEIILPTTSFSYVGVHQSTGEVKERLLENVLTCKPITYKISKENVDKDDVVVTYFESEDKIYIGFYRD